VDERELGEVRSALEDFAGEVFAGLPRADQRATGLRYLRGLMLDGRRKSMQPMGERLGVDYQQLQQFLTSSTWDLTGVRRRLAAKVIGLVEPEVWVVDDTGFPKDGKASACVARQYSGTLGKVANCQIAVSVHAATDAASGVLNWRLFVPEAWDQTCVPDAHGQVTSAHAKRLRDKGTTLDEAGHKKPQVRKKIPAAEQIATITARRAASRIPDQERYRPKWLMALEMIDELDQWGHRPPLLVADAGYGQSAEFRDGLSERGIRYVVATTSSTTAHLAEVTPTTMPYAGRGRRPVARYRDTAPTVKALALAAGQDATQLVRWRHGSRTDRDHPTGELAGHFLARRVRPAGRSVHRTPDGLLPERWLLIEWPPGQTEPSDYWLSDLPADTPITQLVRLAKMRWRIEHDYRELKTGLGLDHFEGRSWIGWHRHVTLTAAAQLFLTQLRLTDPTGKAAGQA
jgi:SRSO17 transposase